MRRRTDRERDGLPPRDASPASRSGGGTTGWTHGGLRLPSGHPVTAPASVLTGRMLAHVAADEVGDVAKAASGDPPATAPRR